MQDIILYINGFSNPNYFQHILILKGNPWKAPA